MSGSATLTRPCSFRRGYTRGQGKELGAPDAVRVESAIDDRIDVHETDIHEDVER